LKTGHNDPKTPKVVLHTAGKVIPKIAPGRALSTINGPTRQYPTMTQMKACHHVRPAEIIDEAMTKVFKLKLSAIQNAT
jgi:hypothetical protein